MSNYVYITTEGSNLFTVGHYTPGGLFVAESDHSTTEEAAQRAAFLNGGIQGQFAQIIRDLNTAIKDSSQEIGMLREHLKQAKRVNESLKGDLDRASKEVDEVEKYAKNISFNRDHFCGSINRIAKMVGMNVENAAPEAVELHIASVLEALTAEKQNAKTLAEWKESMMQLEREFDFQQICKQLGAPIGVGTRTWLKEKINLMVSNLANLSLELAEEKRERQQCASDLMDMKQAFRELKKQVLKYIVTHFGSPAVAQIEAMFDNNFPEFNNEEAKAKPVEKVECTCQQCGASFMGKPGDLRCNDYIPL